MKKLLSVAVAVIMLTSLSACMVVPVYDRPHYREPHRYEPARYPHHPHHHKGRDWRW